jgi:hypothetical protein
MSDPIWWHSMLFSSSSFWLQNFRHFLKNEYLITNSLSFEEKKIHQDFIYIIIKITTIAYDTKGCLRFSTFIF